MKNPVALLGMINVCAVAAFLILTPPGGEFSLAIFLLSVMSLVLQLAAVRLPGFGAFTAAPAAYIGILLLPDSGGLFFPIILVLGLTLRAAFRGDWLGCLAEGPPLLSAGIFVSLLDSPDFPTRVFCVLHTYLILSALTTYTCGGAVVKAEQVLMLRKLGKRLALLWLGAACLGPPLALLSEGTPFASLWFFPVLLALHLGAERAILNAKIDERELLRDALRNSRQQRDQLKRSLTQRVEQSVLREELRRELLQHPELDSTVRTFAETAAGLAPSRSVAVFQGDRGVLYRSSHSKRVELAPLLGLGEKILEVARHRGKVVFADDYDLSESRIFEDESRIAAMPLDSEYTLYLGRRAEDPSFSPEEKRALGFLKNEAEAALEAARRHQSLASQAWRGRTLEASVLRLQELLEVTTRLTATLQLGQIADLIVSAAAKLAPHDRYCLVEGDEALRVSPPQWKPQLLISRVQKSGSAILVESLAGSEFADGETPEGSLLGLPLLAQNEEIGVLVLYGPSGSFTEARVESMALFCRTAGLALRNANLHNRVSDALTELKHSQAQLVDSSKMAAIGQLAAGVAHELNTPLGCILLALESLLVEVDEHSIHTALKAGRRAQKIIGSLLFYSREGNLESQKYSLNTVVQDTAALLRHQFHKDRVAIELDLTPAPQLTGRPGQMQQVVLNLLTNARDASRSAEGAEKTVAVECKPGDGEVVLQVVDRGPGVPPEIAERIFEPFFTTKSVGRGTGLGLSVARQIVKEHGGTLTLERRQGPTVFTVRLPYE